MTYIDRLSIYKEIEKIRGCPLIVYATKNSSVNGGSMSLDSIPEFCEQLLRIPEGSRKVDLFLASQGGDVIAAWRIICLLRERFDEVDVLIPFIAQSAATILSFGADHIVMHPFSCLGPIDPQITIPGDTMQQIPKTFSVEDVQAYIEFAEKDLGMKKELENNKQDSSSNVISSSVLDHLVAELKPTQIGLVKKSMKLSETLAEKLLSLHMSDSKLIEDISKKFNSLTHHGYTIGRKEARDSGLPVEYPSKELEKLIWLAWEDLSTEMKCSSSFDPMASITSDPVQNAKLNQNVASGMPYTMSVSERDSIAFVESIYLSSHFELNTHIFASGNGINISFNVVRSAIGWIRPKGD